MKIFSFRHPLFAFSLLTLLFFSQAQARGAEADPEVVPTVDLQRYSGFWYEIAHAPNFFQKGCTRSTAEYQVISETAVSVHNVCYSADGRTRDIRGKARVVDPKVPAKLEVRFNIFARGEYWIVDLDPDYQWVVVSASKKKSLFILSRTAKMESELLQSILQRLQARGFDVENLIFDEPPTL